MTAIRYNADYLRWSGRASKVVGKDTSGRGQNVQSGVGRSGVNVARTAIGCVGSKCHINQKCDAGSTVNAQCPTFVIVAATIITLQVGMGLTSQKRRRIFVNRITKQYAHIPRAAVFDGILLRYSTNTPPRLKAILTGYSSR